jgi:hypothetical protein
MAQIFDWQKHSKGIRERITQSGANFVSIKYLDASKGLTEFDLAAELFANHSWHDIALMFPFMPIMQLRPVRYFLDPFRAMPTISVFCTNNTGITKTSYDFLQQLCQQVDNDKISSVIVTMQIPTQEAINPNSVRLPGADFYANMRSDLMLVLNNIGLRAIAHYKNLDQDHGREYNAITLQFSNFHHLISDIITTKWVLSNVYANYNLILAAQESIFNDIKIDLNIFVTDSVYLKDIMLLLQAIERNHLYEKSFTYTIKKINDDFNQNLLNISFFISC